VLQASALGHRRAMASHCSLGQALDYEETIRCILAAPAATRDSDNMRMRNCALTVLEVTLTLTVAEESWSGDAR
jgi:hypothetical protein